MTLTDQLRWHFDSEGGEKGIRCGTTNFFSGWVIGDSMSDAVLGVEFSAGESKLGFLPLKHERPDLLKAYGTALVGFWGPVTIPHSRFGSTLRVEAITRIGNRHLLKEYSLDKRVSAEEEEFARKYHLPDDTLRHLVVTDIDPRVFVERGKEGVELIRRTLRNNSIDMSEIKRVLDFGVGCGRVLRWWEGLAPEIEFWGSDTNELLIRWCIENLSFAKFTTNALLPPTSFDAASFDLVYAFSVFTHLTLESQKQWISEFARIIRPQKYLLVSAHGDTDALSLPAEQLDEYHRRGYFTMSANAEGENMCASFQTRRITEELMGECFNVIDMVPGARASTSRQDIYLLKKR